MRGKRGLDRLRRWYRAIKALDPVAPVAAQAKPRLKNAAEALERLAGQVYQTREQPTQELGDY